ncbi:CTTNBP2 N-terminal-like protein isoform X2 [Parasteatoda tepidariorum]|uniref:CTTNBP2 N-terminal-like protein isoform X2 n=1 Tax=Parasteatoda tepidariorum TaxID=114398 RepID=UPI001C727D84|nr:CTTNBP2 N-terminal-like protein isoform X2 [Parasteatoda tepidariorum]
MANRNIGKQQPSGVTVQFEQPEKPSSTLKRHPKMELSKPDLLQLLGVLEGELQAREIVIAVLKAEQVKQLLYPKRKATASDPWAALQRDCLGAFDATFDESAVKNLYGMQLSQFEHFLKQYKIAQIKLKEQLEEAEQRCEKLLSELEDEKQKHAQDTAQGDDVTYLLEKERERLHQENEFERQQNRCMEKDIKCLTETLEQERQRQKQMILVLLAERKRLIYRYAEEKQKCDRLSQILCDEKGRIADMVDGLEEESKKSLQMEAELERQLCEFEIEREQYKAELNELEAKNNELTLEVQKLQEAVEAYQKQASLNAQAQLGEGVRSTIVTMVSTPTIRAVPTISPTVSPPRGVARALSPKTGPAPATPAKPIGLIPQAPTKVGVSKPVSSMSSTVLSPLCSPPLATASFKTSPKPIKASSPAPVTSPSAPENIATLLQVATPVPQYAESPLSPAETDKAIDLNSQSNAKISSSVKVSTPVPAHKPASATVANVVNAKKLPAGRGAPPPIPPNKPVLPPQALHRKDTGSKPPVPPRSDVTPDNSIDKNAARNDLKLDPSIHEVEL